MDHERGRLGARSAHRGKAVRRSRTAARAGREAHARGAPRDLAARRAGRGAAVPRLPRPRGVAPPHGSPRDALHLALHGRRRGALLRGALPRASLHRRQSRARLRRGTRARAPDADPRAESARYSPRSSRRGSAHDRRDRPSRPAREHPLLDRARGEGWPSPRRLMPGVPLTAAPRSRGLTLAVFPLEPAEEDRKLEALRAYDTQLRTIAPFMLAFVRSTELFARLPGRDLP